jgi:hypothetical protein
MMCILSLFTYLLLPHLVRALLLPQFALRLIKINFITRLGTQLPTHKSKPAADSQMLICFTTDPTASICPRDLGSAQANPSQTQISNPQCTTWPQTLL